MNPGDIHLDPSARYAERAKRIVKLAVEKTKDTYTKTWLRMDERGTFEKEARELARKCEEDPSVVAQIKAKGYAPEEVDDICAGELRLLALTARLNVAKKGKRK